MYRGSMIVPHDCGRQLRLPSLPAGRSPAEIGSLAKVDGNDHRAGGEEHVRRPRRDALEVAVTLGVRRRGTVASGAPIGGPFLCRSTSRAGSFSELAAEEVVRVLAGGGSQRT
jgi:hypothetical protein